MGRQTKLSLSGKPARSTSIWIVAGAFGIDDPKKYDYQGGVRRAWMARINSIQLEKVTPQVVQSWKVDFLRRAGQNPAKRRTAKISVNSVLRAARNLFGPVRLKFVTLPAGFSSPGGVR